MFWSPSWTDTDCVQNIIHKQILAVSVVRVIASVTVLQNLDLSVRGLVNLKPQGYSECVLISKIHA